MTNILTKWIFSSINTRSILRINFQRILGGNFPSFVGLQLNIDVEVDVVFYRNNTLLLGQQKIPEQFYLNRDVIMIICLYDFCSTTMAAFLFVLLQSPLINVPGLPWEKSLCCWNFKESKLLSQHYQ